MTQLFERRKKKMIILIEAENKRVLYKYLWFFLLTSLKFLSVTFHIPNRFQGF